MGQQSDKWAFRGLFRSRSVYFIAISILLFGCASKYQNTLGNYRPTNPKYTISDVKSLSALDSIPYKVRYAYDNYLEVDDGETLRVVLTFSEDGRFASASEIRKTRTNTISLSENPWLAGEGIGFYTLKGDTVLMEYFVNYSWGTYVLMEGIMEYDSLRITQISEGSGRHRHERRVHYKESFKKINSVIELY